MPGFQRIRCCNRPIRPLRRFDRAMNIHGPTGRSASAVRLCDLKPQQQGIHNVLARCRVSSALFLRRPFETPVGGHRC